MAETDPGDVTRLLRDAAAGDRQAAEALIPAVYDELRRLARARMAREPRGVTLQPTALVHEALLRLVRGAEQRWESRGHFFAAAAEAMRRILVEEARRRSRRKRGGDMDRVPFADDLAVSGADLEGLLALDEALERLEAKDPTMARVVKLRHFAGLTVEETARALALSPRTVNRHWTAASAWLRREMRPGGATGSTSKR
jgi:RNA polymerase sigma factor (TIGR02999 family)